MHTSTIKRDNSLNKYTKISVLFISIIVTGSDEVYDSKWFAYKYFEFLADKDIPRETVNTASEVSGSLILVLPRHRLI